MTKEIKQQGQDIQPKLERCIDWLSQLSEEKFKGIIYRRYNIQDNNLYMQTREKINDIIREGYKDCLNMSRLSRDKGICLYNIEASKEFDEDSEPVEYRTSGCPDGENFSLQLNPPEKFKSSIPCFELESGDILVGGNTRLMWNISNSHVPKDAIEQDKNINKYSLLYGNNPILLAISKGWNHVNGTSFTDKSKVDLEKSINCGKQILREFESREYSAEQQKKIHYLKRRITEEKNLLSQISGLLKQKDIINKLLEREDLDINCIHLSNGMTPLHIACLRGDSPELIQKLLNRRADLSAVNYKGEKPIDLLGYSYEDTQEIIENITGGYTFGIKDLYTECDENQSAVTTLPTREERESNIKVIKEILCTTKSRSDTSEGLFNQFHAQLNLEGKDGANKQCTPSTSSSVRTNDSQVNRSEGKIANQVSIDDNGAVNNQKKLQRPLTLVSINNSNDTTVDNQIPKCDNAKKVIAIATLVTITVMVPLSIYFIVQANLLAAGITVGCIIVAATVLYCSYNAKVDNKSPSKLLKDLKSDHKSFIGQERNSKP